jgi:uncharacterized membrane protein YfcA
MPAITAIHFLLATFGLVAGWCVWEWLRFVRRDGHRPLGPRAVDSVIGFVANFFDTLGIGSFATTTTAFKLLGRPRDEEIPGTLNVGHALPTIVQALIFVALVTVDVVTLFSMLAAAMAGAWLGGRIVSSLPRRAIQIGMGIALLCAALLFCATNLQLLPGGGEALGLQGISLAAAIVGNFVLGGLMMLGIGLYAPCMILVSVLGMSPLAAFPVMMGSCAVLMPVGARQFFRSARFDSRAAVGLAIGGIPAVLVAAFIVKSLPLVWLRWLVVIVVLYAALQMLLAARRTAQAEAHATA